ncbi:hypothetical protein A2U01_0055157, partial [Trifolium medium]|nr:hypothetical protein [Trifolium medium]
FNGFATAVQSAQSKTP